MAKFFGESKEEKKTPNGEKYKFKALEVYASVEWMFGSTKKYRRVFDKNEVDYIRADFSFYNKLFDEQDWTAELRLKAFNISKNKRKEICNQDETITISQDENIVHFHKGWGNETIGAFWKKGTYLWEAYIDNKLVGSQEFHIEDVGKVTKEENPYFDVVSLKLFNSGYDGWETEDRKYLKKFNRKETQFIWCEFRIKNKISSSWNCELSFNFYDDAGQLKGQTRVLKQISHGNKDRTFTFDEGWGTREGGSWIDDNYTVEIVFMDTLVAVIPFEVGDEEIEGTSPFKTSICYNEPTEIAVEEPEETLEDVLGKLDTLIGLREVKRKIKEHISYIEFIQLRKDKGFKDVEIPPLHSVFTGNPGTGKTTVVNLLGKIYLHLGLLSKGHVHEVDRADLIGEFIGQTAPKVKEIIKEARGGILFIDEAYSLARKDDDSKDFGKEAIEIIIREMSDGEGDIAIMLAGYPEEMGFMLNSNPGLRSRVNYYFHFDDYLPEELLDIAKLACEQRAVILENEAEKSLSKILINAFRGRDNTFGNARYVFSLIDEGKMNMGLRLMKRPDVKKLSNKELSTITKADINKIIEKTEKPKLDINIDENLLRESLQELNNLIGMENIKNEINEQVKLVRYYRETGKDVLNQFSLHTVFSGNPGTGKTTIARIIGKIYKALGLLERGHVVECDREGLVAGFIGQTAIKTRERIKEAMGGVLFIDEAYSLAQGNQNDFGSEAIEVLLKTMEDERGKFSIIVAGYPKNMQTFLKSNPGIHSRFDRTLNFNDYQPETLYKIALAMFAKENITPDEEASKFITEYLENLYRSRDKYFGNARAVRSFVEESIRNQHLRMASLAATLRSKQMMETLTIDDVKEFKIQTKKPKIGF